MPEPTLDAKQKRALAAALLACPSMADRARRAAIIRELPEAIQQNIARSDAGLLDVTNTLNAALNYPRGLATLLDLVRLFEGESVAMAEVERVVAEILPPGRAVPVAPRAALAAGPTGDRWTLQSPLQMEFVRVPAGEFLMGSDPELDKDANLYGREQPQHCLYLPEYYIGKCPVTVVQYTAFAQATRRAVPEEQGGPDHPVINVRWVDAVVFCRWLSQRSGLAIRLPSEAEWEKAARGMDGRIYPWGDAPPNVQRGNFFPNVGGTTPVGECPAGASPYGALDMIGNVCEWTGSVYQGYPYLADDGREDLQAEGARVLRGGSWDDFQRHARCAYRNRDYPDPVLFLQDVGFRVVVYLSSSGF